MQLVELELCDFRSFAAATFRPEATGITVIVGPNGSGKTTLLEAVGYLGTQRSFRATPREALVRTGEDHAVVRARLQEDRREVLVEADIVPGGRSRAQVNRQAARSRRDLAKAVPVTIFCPDDLGMVQGAPARRRALLDDALALLDPMSAALVDQVERILRQRASLLRQAGGRSTPEVLQSLEVWDERLGTAGGHLVEAREELVGTLGPLLEHSYSALAGRGSPPPGPLTDLAYRRSWEGPLTEALVGARRDDLRRGVSTIGPHRDDLAIALGGRDSRIQASQGEQRCLALALRLAVHRLVTERLGQPPILLLDDVFSELDPTRSSALLRELPAGQALLTTATPVPATTAVAAVVDVATVGQRPGWTERTPA